MDSGSIVVLTKKYRLDVNRSEVPIYHLSQTGDFWQPSPGANWTQNEIRFPREISVIVIIVIYKPPELTEN